MYVTVEIYRPVGFHHNVPVQHHHHQIDKKINNEKVAASLLGFLLEFVC